MRHLLIVGLLICSSHVYGQYIQLMTLSAGGITGSQGSKTYLTHVISQSSIVAGTARNGSLVVRQGFKQPFGQTNWSSQTSTSSLLSIAKRESIQFNVFPNPFLDQVHVVFSSPPSQPIQISLYDSNSELVWNRTYPEDSQSLELSGFEKLSTGKYLLQVFYHGEPVMRSLIKEVRP